MHKQNHNSMAKYTQVHKFKLKIAKLKNNEIIWLFDEVIKVSNATI